MTMYKNDCLPTCLKKRWQDWHITREGTDVMGITRWYNMACVKAFVYETVSTLTGSRFSQYGVDMYGRRSLYLNSSTRL